MRVTILLKNFPIGGAENMVYELVRHIKQDRVNISVLCYGTRESTALSSRVEEICPVKYLGLTGEISFASIERVCQALDELKPDVVHAHMGSVVFAAIWSLFRGKGFVATVHTEADKAFNWKVELLLRVRMLFNKACLVAVSKQNAMLVKKHFKLPEWKYGCVNNGIDLTKFYSVLHTPFTYINVARHDANKNQRMLLKSFARARRQNKEMRLILVGDGPTHEELKSDAKELGIDDSVVFTGNVSDVEVYYAQSDVFVLCSHQEAMPLSALEAMAAGLPIISSRVGGMVDVVQDNGLLLKENCEDELTNAILQMYNERSSNEYLKKASLRIVQNYSAQEMADQYIEIYTRVRR